MQETHAEIVAWLDDTFGPASSNFRVATRAQEELSEALRAIAADPLSDKAAVEAADTIIVLTRLAHTFGLDWGAFEVDRAYVPPKFNTTVEYFTHANRFMSQLLCGLAVCDDWPDGGETCARIYVTLQYAIRRWDLEPSDVIAAKMLVNRGRVWRKYGDGTGYHIQPEKIERPGLRGAGLFMGVPLFVADGMDLRTFVILKRRLSEPEPGDRTRPYDPPENLDAVGPDPRLGLGKITMADTLGARRVLDTPLPHGSGV